MCASPIRINLGNLSAGPEISTISYRVQSFRHQQQERHSVNFKNGATDGRVTDPRGQEKTNLMVLLVLLHLEPEASKIALGM